MLTMLVTAYWGFCQFMLSEASTFAIAFFWQKVLVFWPFLIALILHFTLSFTESDLLKNKLVYVALYFPALAFSLIDLSTNWISGAPRITPWGYTAGIQLTVVSRIDGIWAAVVSLLAVLMIVSYYNHVVDKTRRQQTLFVAVGFGIPIFISLLTDSLFPLAGINFPVLGSIAGALTSLLVVYAMLRYELFGFRPEIAAESVFSSMLDGIILVNLEGLVIKINKYLVDLSGYEEREIIGKPVSFFIKNAQVLNKESTLPQLIAELSTRRQVNNYEFTFRSKSNQIKTCVLSGSMVSDARGQDVGIAFVLHDITERQEMAQKLLKAERLASIGELAGILGHDLRNPLNAIRAASYYLKTKHSNTLDVKDRVMFESIEKSIDYSDKIVNDLIEYGSEIKLQSEIATARTLLMGALALAPLPQNVKLIDETQEMPLYVDVDRIHRAFMNIIKNAYDAMPAGGVLTVKSQQSIDMMVFSFKDSGDGMTQETLAKIWAPLFTTKAKGMGFGLPITKRIIEAHNGRIAVQSQLKAGTTITIELPLKVESQSSS
jgi:PAS domain S-box-containing protein